VYATNGNITIHTRPDQIIIITDRFADTVHLSPTDAAFVRDALDPVDAST
jgi:hypothetical protein